MRHYKAALYGVTRKAIGQKSAEAIVANACFNKQDRVKG